MKPVPEDISTSFKIEDQWFMMSMQDAFKLDPRPRKLTNRQTVEKARSLPHEEETFGNFVHIRLL